jgi:hypothetical protein
MRLAQVSIRWMDAKQHHDSPYYILLPTVGTGGPVSAYGPWQHRCVQEL